MNSDPSLTRLWLALKATPRLGIRKALSLLQRYSIQQIFQLSAEQLQNLSLSSQQVQYIRHPDWAFIDRVMSDCQRQGISIIHLHDKRYPEPLKQIAAAPLVLFCKGDLTYLAAPKLAIIGSRHCTYYGKEKAHFFAGELAQQGFVIVSGMALGIDTQAHLGCLQQGQATIAVLGAGLNHIYPKRNLVLSEKIGQQGLLISEFWPDTPPRASNFPRRNRIISGLSLGVFVVEASQRSGSLITARYALEQNRDVFALPGSIDNGQACGCHYLIQQGAKLVTQPVDILEELLLMTESISAQLNLIKHQNVLQEDKSQVNALPFAKLLDSVGFEATPIDVVVERSGETVQFVQSQLLEMELEGLIAQVPEGYVKLGRN
ncbi:DNA-protecting protein DprA [Motilimonas pumila]|uniref:DNA-protecting protein DprA n=1 Tax=Motilimonas pumila TaxID=2303987 RepID=A0A418YJ90_9GAMM|nr:DNA-protecting protein DprA [Motilimonas pumila]